MDDERGEITQSGLLPWMHRTRLLGLHSFSVFLLALILGICRGIRCSNVFPFKCHPPGCFAARSVCKESGISGKVRCYAERCCPHFLPLMDELGPTFCGSRRAWEKSACYLCRCGFRFTPQILRPQFCCGLKNTRPTGIDGTPGTLPYSGQAIFQRPTTHPLTSERDAQISEDASLETLLLH